MAPHMSQRQERILAYIETFIRDHGYSPAIRDIQNALHISSTSVVAYNLKALQSKGLLAREGKISRGIRLAERDIEPAMLTSMLHPVPLLGVITAGQPLPNPEDTSTRAELINVPADLLPSERANEIYALRVRGTSMIDALIDDGDIVLMRKQETAENGQMVAVWLTSDNSVTLKKFYREGDRVRLQPANSTMDPIYRPANDVRVQGRVVGVMRSMER